MFLSIKAWLRGEAQGAASRSFCLIELYRKPEVKANKVAIRNFMQMPKVRMGGRSARVRAAIFEATSALLAVKSPAEITMVEIAEHADVAATSLYRRWGDVQALLMDVAIDQLMRDKPLPDTGSLRGDLLTWAKLMATSLAKPEKSVFVRVLLATISGNSDGRRAALIRRRDEIEAMLDRARPRGETAPNVDEVTDYILAPLYLRMLTGAPLGKRHATALVDRLLQ
jgi:AcrR family transcriptional regulator